jgi:hypothetical protein
MLTGKKAKKSERAHQQIYTQTEILFSPLFCQFGSCPENGNIFTDPSSSSSFLLASRLRQPQLGPNQIKRENTTK